MKLRTLLIFMFLAVSMIPLGIIGGVVGFQGATLFLMGLIVLVTFVVSLIIAHLVSLPLVRLTRDIDEISKGNLDVTLEKGEIFEINNLTASLDRVMASLKLAIHKVGVKRGEIFEETVKAKEEAEEKYQDLLKTIDDWVWETNDKGVYTSCSAQVSKALGYNPAEIVGKTVFDFMSSDEAKQLKNVFAYGEKNGGPFNKVETWYQHKDGHKICVSMSGMPLLNDDGKCIGYRGVMHDITAYKHAEATIEELNKKLSDMQGKVRDALADNKKPKARKKKQRDRLEDKWTQEEFDSVFIFDDQANVLDCNDNMYKNLGYTKGEMLSLNITDFDVLQTKDDIKDKINQTKKSGGINFKTIHKRKDGSAILVSERIEYLKNQDRFKCVVKSESQLKS
jgi:PAS domain S-box-containing protein